MIRSVSIFRVPCIVQPADKSCVVNNISSDEHSHKDNISSENMGSKASVHTSVKDSRRGSKIERSEKTSFTSSTRIYSHDRRILYGSAERSCTAIREERKDGCLEEKCREIKALTEENAALRAENSQLTTALEDLRTRVQNESLNHSQMSLSSGISSHTEPTDLSRAASSGPLLPGSPWSIANSPSPDISQKSPASRQRRYLMPMSDIEAYGKGLNPRQVHYITPTPSTGTIGSKEDELNGNMLE